VARTVFGGNPYYFVGKRRYRLARLRCYIIGEHRRGRALAQIVRDPYVGRCGSEAMLWAALEDPQTLRALEEDVRVAIEGAHP
jgi:hypothetical protein